MRGRFVESSVSIKGKQETSWPSERLRLSEEIVRYLKLVKADTCLIHLARYFSEISIGVRDYSSYYQLHNYRCVQINTVLNNSSQELCDSVQWLSLILLSLLQESHYVDDIPWVTHELTRMNMHWMLEFEVRNVGRLTAGFHFYKRKYRLVSVTNLMHNSFIL
jgi:hypothetical protein